MGKNNTHVYIYIIPLMIMIMSCKNNIIGIRIYHISKRVQTYHMMYFKRESFHTCIVRT